MMTKEEIIKTYQLKEGDTGSAEVQIALLTDRIQHLTEHLKANKHDNHSRRGLYIMIGKRSGLLKYLEENHIDRYRSIKTKLGIR